jgi:trehalose 6-phosphate phosphatase
VEDPGRRAPRPRLSLARAVSSIAGRGAESGFFFDFDGTLAPIQEDPDTVLPVPGAVAALGRLAAVARRVDIVSARPVAFLRGRLAGAEGLTLHGLYGLETLRDGGPLETDAAALPWVPLVAEVAGRARRELPAGVRVELKRLAVALHYRREPGRRDDVERWARDQAARHGLLAQPGRMVVELKPPVERDKGDVVRVEAAGLACAWYFGDDLSDLEAFAALAEGEGAGDGFTGVRVAVANAETGAQLAAEADFVIGSPEEVPGVLATVTRALSPEP